MFSPGNGNEYGPSISTFLSEQWLQPCRRFEFPIILLATDDFDESLVIGHGGFGKVYKGTLFHGSSTPIYVAIKRLNSKSNQGASEFWAEVKMLSKLRHRHLVSLIGYCNHEEEMILVYEYMPLGTLEDHLHKLGTSISWIQRLRISIGSARGLEYLHTGTSIEFGIIHRDIKTSNILLHENCVAKISDFGLSRIIPTTRQTTFVNTLVKGTFGYLDPNYFHTGKLTRKSDVYAFGVVLFELLCRKRAVDRTIDEEQWGLAPWAQESIKVKKLKQIIDPEIRGDISPKCLKEFVGIAERCLQGNPKHRPTMAEVVVSLEYAMSLQVKSKDSLRTPGKIIDGIFAMFRFTARGENSEKVNRNGWNPATANTLLDKKPMVLTSMSSSSISKDSRINRNGWNPATARTLLNEKPMVLTSMSSSSTSNDSRINRGLVFEDKIDQDRISTDESCTQFSADDAQVVSQELVVVFSKKSTTMEVEHGYVKDILSDIESMFEDFILKGSSKIVNPLLFDQLEAKISVSEKKIELKLRRKLVFDFVSSFVDSICCVLPRGLAAVKEKDRVVEQVCDEILGWEQISCKLDEHVSFHTGLDEVFYKDISTTSTYKWFDFDVEAFELGKEIEQILLASLIDETLFSISVRPTSFDTTSQHNVSVKMISSGLGQPNNPVATQNGSKTGKHKVDTKQERVGFGQPNNPVATRNGSKTGKHKVETKQERVRSGQPNERIVTRNRSKIGRHKGNIKKSVHVRSTQEPDSDLIKSYLKWPLERSEWGVEPAWKHPHRTVVGRKTTRRRRGYPSE